MSTEMSINMSTELRTEMSTDPRTNYLVTVALGRAIIDKKNYEVAMKNLEYAKAYLEKADDAQKEGARESLVYAERSVLYFRAIMEGLFPDPNPSSSTIMYIEGQAALSKVGEKRDRDE